MSEPPKAGELWSRDSCPVPTVVRVLAASGETVRFKLTGPRTRPKTWPLEKFTEMFKRTNQ